MVIRKLIAFHTRWFNAETKLGAGGRSLALVIIGICLPCLIAIPALALLNSHVISLSPNQNFFIVAGLCGIWIAVLAADIFRDLSK